MQSESLVASNSYNSLIFTWKRAQKDVEKAGRVLRDERVCMHVCAEVWTCGFVSVCVHLMGAVGMWVDPRGPIYRSPS